MDVSCLIPQPLTGVGYYTFHLLHALLARERGLDVRLFGSMARGKSAAVQRLAFSCSRTRVVRFPARLKNWLWTSIEWPPIEWFTGAVDIAHGAFHLLPATKRARRMLTVFDLSGLRYPDSRSAGNLRRHVSLLRHAVAHADAIVAISHSCKADLIELLDVPEARIHVVYGGVFLDEFDGALDEDALAALKGRLGLEGDYLIHLGTLEPRKNLPRLLEAYARVREDRGDCPKLVLAGRAGWMFDDVFETIERLRLSDHVVHTGYLERADAVALLRGARGCAYPSLYEGFGLPVLEAMAARIPVMTSNVSSMPEVVGGTGILIEPESVESIAAGLEALLGRTGAEWTDAAYKRAGRFTWEHSADALEAVYRRLHAGDGR
ncbi:MAG: glycosyltransferase [Nitrospiraceae bacterium]|nr:glycosyltransferase [Nitrospiraceae bacterium]